LRQSNHHAQPLSRGSVSGDHAGGMIGDEILDEPLLLV